MKPSHSRIHRSRRICQFCGKDYVLPNPLPPGYSPKLLELCRKYLHSAILQESSISKDHNFSLCMKCFDSAMELADFCQQIEFIQKSISNLAFVFSLEILRRRGKIANIGDIIPNFESWSAPTPPSNLSPTGHKSQETVSEIRNTDDFNDSLLTRVLTQNKNSLDLSIVKCENYQQEWAGGNEEIGQDIEKGTNLQLANESEMENISADQLESRKQISATDLGKLEFQIHFAVEKDFPGARDPENQSSHAVWTKSYSEGNYVMNEENTKQLEKRRALTSSPHHSHMSTEPSSSTEAKALFSEEQPPIPLADNKLISESPSRRSSRKHRTHFNKEQYESNEMVTSPPLTFRHNEIPIGESVSTYEASTDGFASHVPLLMNKTIEYAYGCNFCNKRYKNKHQLIRHQTTHMGERPFQCALCSKSFNQQGTLQFHHRTHHSKEKRFKCPTCDKRFVHKNYLLRHLRVHTGNNHIQCDQCDYAGNLHSLKIHKYQVHYKLKEFKCRECGNGFESLELVKLHYTESHSALEFSDDCVIKSNLPSFK